MSAAVIGASASTGIVTAEASASTIKEAGSSLVFPLVSVWANHYTGATVQAAAGGSGLGISDAANPSSSGIDIGASDAPETSAQYANNKGDVTQIPWALSATTAAYNIPGVGGGLKLSGSVLAKIFNGKITSWGNSSITKLNPHYKSALKRAGSITPVFRSDGSGDSYAFQHFLTESAGGAWPYSYSTQWGASTGKGENGNSGIAGEVRTVRGAIGYISAYYAISQHIHVAALKNAAGKYILPNASNIEAAAKSNSSISSQGSGFTGLNIIYPGKRFKTAYPAATYTYAIVNHSDPNKGAVKDFLNWVISGSGGQKYGGNLDFLPLPSGVRSADSGLINSL